jgi:hypothetical protein
MDYKKKPTGRGTRGLCSLIGDDYAPADNL